MPRLAIDRFVEKCRFNALTGCVEWTGAKTRGRGHHDWYGSFWFERESWLAHRWAAYHIHGLPIDDLQVDHVCGNTLCVQHLQSITPTLNRELQWIRTQVGLLPPPPEYEPNPDDVPFFYPPTWLTRIESVAYTDQTPRVPMALTSAFPGDRIAGARQ